MPLILVAILAGGFFSQRGRLGTVDTTGDGGFRIVSIMGGARHTLTGEPVPGGTVVTVMGSSVLDLGRADVRPGTPLLIDGVTFMGRSVLYVPDDWQVELNSASLFGVVRDRRHRGAAPPAAAASVNEPAPPVPAPSPGPAGTKLQVRGAVMFGSIDLRSPGDQGEEREP